MRIIGDYRRLNLKTLPDRYPLPNLSDCVQNLIKSRCFTNLDLVRAFHNTPVFEDHRKKTAVVSCAGFYEYRRMPFGLRNAPATFQRFVDNILHDLPYVFTYTDDILVFSETEEQHYEHLNEIFARLVKNRLSLNVKKSQFCMPEVRFLGFKITKDGYLPQEDRIQRIKEMVRLKTIVALRRVIGMFNYYRNFKKEAAETLAPLNDALKGHTRKNDRTPIKWTSELIEAFEKSKNLFSSYTLLRYPRTNSVLFLTADASDEAMGTVLEQLDENGEKEPLGYYSEKLNDT